MRSISAALVLLLLLAASPASAQALTGSSRAVGLSGAMHAYSNGTASLWANPAGMSLVHQYMLEGGYQYWRRAGEHEGTIAVVDSKTNPSFAAGGSYTYHHGAASGDPDGALHRVNVGAATRFDAGSVGVHLGALYRYGKTAIDAAHDADVGAILSFSRMVNIGVVGRNLFNPTPGVSSRQLVSGVSVGQESFLVAFDATTDFDAQDTVKMIYAVGAEVFVAGAAGIRAGYRFDRVAGDRHSISAGFGYVYRNVGVDLAFEQNPSVGKDNRFVGALVFFIP